MFAIGASSRLQERRSAEALVYHSWYNTARWRRRRAEQLRAEPFCAMCLSYSGVFQAATVADHREPHRGDPVKFWTGELQSLCKPHHDRDKKLIEAGRPLLGCDDDGWPITGS